VDLSGEVLGTRVHRVLNRYHVALIIEGGGPRGMFSAGMCLGSKNAGSSRIRCGVQGAAGLPGKRVAEVKSGFGEDDHANDSRVRHDWDVDS
jgi:hypothetical protein